LSLKSLQGFGMPAESFGFANKQLAWETIAPLLDRASPLHTAHLRESGPQGSISSVCALARVPAGRSANDP
jgi:nicotinate dehydrogenase subunit B